MKGTIYDDGSQENPLFDVEPERNTLPRIKQKKTTGVKRISSLCVQEHGSPLRFVEAEQEEEISFQVLGDEKLVLDPAMAVFTELSCKVRPIEKGANRQTRPFHSVSKQARVAVRERAPTDESVGAEVDENDPPVLRDHDVLELQVTMDDLGAMERCQGIENPARDGLRVGEREWPSPPDPLGQQLPVDERVGHVRLT